MSHEAFSQVAGSFEETVDNIQRAIASGISVSLSTVLHRGNLAELGDIVDLAQRLKANHVAFNRYLGPEIPELAVTATDLEKAVHTIDAMRKQGKPATFGNCIPQCFTPSSSTGCLAGVAYCTVDPWGNVRPCNHSSLIAGNLLKDTLDHAWHSLEMERFRQAIPSACRGCAAFPTCHGGCKALAMELGISGDPISSTPLERFDLPVIHMSPQCRPQGRFKIRQENFGLVLLNGNAILPVRPEAVTVLNRLDGKSTLLELEPEIGSNGMTLIGELVRRKMVEMIC